MDIGNPAPDYGVEAGDRKLRAQAMAEETAADLHAAREAMASTEPRVPHAEILAELGQRPAYRVQVRREDGWLMVHVPEIDAVTQARHEGEIELMARDLIAIVEEIDPDSFDLDIETP